MATYTPNQLRPTIPLTASAQDLVKPGTNHTSIIRTFVVQANTAARTVTLDMASSTTDAAGSRFVDAYTLTANVPWIVNCWIVCDTTTWLVGLASAGGSTVMFTAWGYDFI